MNRTSGIDVLKKVARRALPEWGFVTLINCIRAYVHPSNRGQRLRSLIKFLGFAIYSRRGRLVTVPYASQSKFLASIEETSSRRAAVARFPDFAEMCIWTKSLDEHSLFVDVGANVGLYSILAGEAGADVIALEPVDALADRLEMNARLNHLALTIHREAVSDSPGSVIVSADKDSFNHLIMDGGSGVRVDATTLDDLLGERVADGVKIDVQGAEELVLRGATRALAEHRIHLLQVEWNDWSEALIGRPRSHIADLLREHGYSLFRPGPDGVLIPTDGYDSRDKSDVFAAPSDPTR